MLHYNSHSWSKSPHNFSLEHCQDRKFFYRNIPVVPSAMGDLPPLQDETNLEEIVARLASNERERTATQSLTKTWAILHP